MRKHEKIGCKVGENFSQGVSVGPDGSQGFIYKDYTAQLNPQHVAYIAENSDTHYFWRDFLQLAKGNSETARALFDAVYWQLPETLVDDWARLGIIICERCGAIFFVDDDGSEPSDVCKECISG